MSTHVHVHYTRVSHTTCMPSYFVIVATADMHANNYFHMSFVNVLILMHQVPTTVFTPLEYGAIGFTERQAIDQFGEENVEVRINK